MELLARVDLDRQGNGISRWERTWPILPLFRSCIQLTGEIYLHYLPPLKIRKSPVAPLHPTSYDAPYYKFHDTHQDQNAESVQIDPHRNGNPRHKDLPV